MDTEEAVIAHFNKRATPDQQQHLIENMATWRTILKSLMGCHQQRLDAAINKWTIEMERAHGDGDDALAEFADAVYRAQLQSINHQIGKYQREFELIDRIELFVKPDHAERYKALDFLREAIKKHKRLKGEGDFIDRALWDALEGKETIFEEL